MGRQGGRADTGGRGVAGPFFVHDEVEPAVADQQHRRRHPENPPDRRGSRDGESGRWPCGEPVRHGSAGAEEAEEGQGHPVIAGALEELPHPLPGEGAQARGLESPERHVEDDRANRLDQREDANRDVNGADHGHELPRPRLRDPEDREIRQPGGLGDDAEGSVADEASGDGDAKDPVQRRRRVRVDHRRDPTSRSAAGADRELGDAPPVGAHGPHFRTGWR